mgnify:CR=1 FL=1
MANKGLRVEEAPGGLNDGDPAKFDPMSALSNPGTQQDSIQEVKAPPVEDVLMCRTLWPESQKLYGHAFEIYCVAASHKGDCAASACKAKQEAYADIIIWQIV